jgi:hypothetical protein
VKCLYAGVKWTRAGVNYVCAGVKWTRAGVNYVRAGGKWTCAGGKYVCAGGKWTCAALHRSISPPLNRISPLLYRISRYKTNDGPPHPVIFSLFCRILLLHYNGSLSSKGNYPSTGLKYRAGLKIFKRLCF